MNFIQRHLPISAFFLVLIVATAALVAPLGRSHALLAGFDLAAIVGLTLVVRRYMLDDSRRMRLRAAANDVDHLAVVTMGLLIVAVILVAVWVELTADPGLFGRSVSLGLASTTLVMAWLFANTLFALHYAHNWYAPGPPGKDGKTADRKGLLFPGNAPEPDYWDFSYFAFVIAMTFQVSDVQVTSRQMRRLALVHGLLAFFFNIAVVALSVNLVADVLR
jgi:uncharacterized membrane protein